MTGPRLAFVAHATFCERCVTLLAPRERRQALGFQRVGPLRKADLPAGTRVRRGDGKVGTVQSDDLGEEVLVLIEGDGPAYGAVYSPGSLQLEAEPVTGNPFDCAEGWRLAVAAERDHERLPARPMWWVVLYVAAIALGVALAWSWPWRFA